ncbi:MAG: Holliday junction resolvase RuvX [Patescibacteria group bacterium]|nr:Holliday junction resolvase RuvX [Patescibacteria group bacterium]MDD5164321.1 Holliday junction resolvase RuvX [Patescibacteria group bacterium]MDD5534767.1 Holliday junction resolvase RuvX [Patescibacteria group bacterium]
MILAIDYGNQHIGLAIADSKMKIVFPYKVLEYSEPHKVQSHAPYVVHDQGFEKLLIELKEIIKKEKIEKIIVGRPMGMQNNLTDQTKITDEFVQKLKKAIELPIEIFDERLTSKMAKSLSKGGEGNIHSGSAMIILQDYLDKLKI